MGKMAEELDRLDEAAWQRRDLERTAAYYEAEADRPNSNPEYRRFCLDRAKRLREAAEPCPET